MDIRGPRKSDPVVHLRRILVYSSANAAGQARARALKLAQAAGELDKLVRTAGTRFHPDAGAVAARVQAIAARRRAGKYLHAAITVGQVGKPVPDWRFDQDAIDAEAAADGWYALTANLPPGQAGPAGVSAATKASTSSNAATASSKVPSPSPRSSWNSTGGSPP